MSIFLTIFAGVCTFIIGQIIVRLFIEPIQEFRAIVGEIAVALTNHAMVYFNPGVLKKERNDSASDELRLLASRISAQANLIPFYNKICLFKWFKLPSREDLFNVRKQLIGMSNGLHDKEFSVGQRSLGEINALRAEKISNLLFIYIPNDEKLYPDNVEKTI